jgi:thiamine biosynthesis lipoprotein
MPASGPGRAGDWCPVNVGAATVGVAERDALGTTARVVVWPPNWAGRVFAAVDAELALLDKQASRFRDDSEISRLHDALASPDIEDPAVRRSCIVSEGLAEAISVALAAAEWTGGLVDPTVGGAVCDLGYDRDFAALPQVTGDAAPPEPGCVPGWQSVRLDGRRLRLAAGVRLDLGATAKGLGSDRAARAAAACVPGGGVLVSLGGDIAVAGEPPLGGWPVLVSDEPGRHGPGPARGPGQVGPPGELPGQQVRLPAGGLATSSIRCRQWRRGGRTLHHIVDPRTGLPAAGPWRTASVAAASCAEANAAATAAIVAGERAAGWLAAQGLPARLVAHDGSVRLLGGWPATEGGLVEVPAAPRMPAAPSGRAEGSGRPGRTG